MHFRDTLPLLNFVGGIIIGSIVYPVVVPPPNQSHAKGVVEELHHNLQVRSSGKAWTGLKFTYLDNYLDHFPNELFQIGNIPSFLTFLAIEGQSIRSLPGEIASFNLLETLAITDSHLETLPSEIGYLKKLKNLSLSGNRLKTLPLEIGQLESLEFLLLGNNDLVSLPQEITQLQNLKILDLKDNQLSSVPASLEKLSKLETLFLGENKLDAQEKQRIQSLLPHTKIYF